MKLFYLLIFSLLICVVCVSATPVLQGSCTLASICNVTASYINGSESYYAELQGCAMNTLYANGNRTFNWAYGGNSTTTTAIGQIFTSTQRICPQLKTTVAENSSGAGFVRVNCSAVGDGAKNDWYFYDTYINVSQTANVSFYGSNYFNIGFGNASFFNSSGDYPFASSLTNYNVSGGLIGVAFTDSSTDMLAYAFDSSIISVGLRSPITGPPTLGVGRGGVVSANGFLNMSIKVLSKDSSQPDNASYTYPLRKFGFNKFYGDSLCEWGGFDNFVINNTRCNITHGFNLAKYNFTISNSTVYINKTTIPSNYTYWYRIMQSIIWRKTI